MKDFKGFIGGRSKDYLDTVDEVLHSKFCHAVASPRGNSPTIWTRCRLGEFELLSSMGLTLEQVLHAEQEYELDQDGVPGFSYSYSTTLKDVVEKNSKDARLHFLVFETLIVRTSDQRRCAIARSTIVHREKNQ